MTGSSGTRQTNDLEAEVYRCLQEADKVAEKDAESELELDQPHTKSWWIKQAVNAAVIARWGQKEIAKKLWDVVEKNNYDVSRRTIQRVCKRMGCVDDFYSHGDDDTMSPKNSSIHAQRNERLMTLFQNDIDFKKALISRLENNPFLELIPDEIVEESLYLYEKNINNVSQENDGRQDVSERKFFMLYLAQSMALNDKATELYLKYVKEWEPLTGKQYHKLMSGTARLVHPLFDPKTESEAADIGMYTTQCKQFECSRCHSHYGQAPKVCKEIIRRKNATTGEVIEKPCEGTEFHQCFSRRVGIEGEGEEFKVKCFACHAVFRPETRRLPVSAKVMIDQSFSRHRR